MKTNFDRQDAKMPRTENPLWFKKIFRVNKKKRFDRQDAKTPREAKRIFRDGFQIRSNKKMDGPFFEPRILFCSWRLGVLAVIYLLVGSVFADEIATSGRQFTALSQSARESAMGGSFSALSEDAMGAFGNPAGLVQLEKDAIGLSHLSWFGGTGYESAAFAKPLGRDGSLGAGLSFYWVPGFDNTGGLEGSVSSLGYQGLLAYGRRIENTWVPRLSGGAALRYTGSSTTGTQSINDLSLDLGLFHQAAWKPLRLGLVLQGVNFLTNAKNAQPLSLKLGAAFSDKDKLLALEAVRVTGQNFQLQLGGEYLIQRLFTVRAGLKVQDAVGSPVSPAFGAGLRINETYRLDYAASSLGDLGFVHWISLDVQFGGTPPLKKIPVTNPGIVPTPVTKRPVPVRTPRPRVPTPVPTPSPVVEKGDFPLLSTVSKNTVELSWVKQTLSGGEVPRYDVYLSMVPGAQFKKVTDKPLTDPHWSEEMGLRGMTYYFKVKVLDKDGKEAKVSEMKGVFIP